MAVAAIALAVTIIALVAAMSGDDAPQRCKGVFGGQEFEYDCALASGGAAGATRDASEPWWSTDVAQTIYAFIGFGGSLTAAGWAYWRVRARRQRLHAFMHRIDDTVATQKARPADGSRALVDIRREIRTAFRSGRMDDAHFLELDKRATSAILKLRLLELDQRFPVLPPTLRGQVVTLIGDGNVSEAEVGLVRNGLGSQLVPGRVREDLVILLEAWAAQDSGAPGVLDPFEPHSPQENVLVRVQEP